MTITRGAYGLRHLWLPRFHSQFLRCQMMPHLRITTPPFQGTSAEISGTNITTSQPLHPFKHHSGRFSALPINNPFIQGQPIQFLPLHLTNWLRFQSPPTQEPRQELQSTKPSVDSSSSPLAKTHPARVPLITQVVFPNCVSCSSPSLTFARLCI